MDVSDLTGSAKSVNAKTWKATVTVTVKDETGALVSGATVTGTWYPGSAVTATTGTTGTCSFSSSFSTTVASATFSVTNIVKAGYTYDASLNPAANSVAISKP